MSYFMIVSTNKHPKQTKKIKMTNQSSTARQTNHTQKRKKLQLKRLHNPHDKVFKYLLKEVTIARDFFSAHLPDRLKPQCDLSTLRICETSYVEEDYQAHLSDILYQVNIQGETGYLYCLIEQVSEPSLLLPFQVLRYQTSILQQHLSQLPKRERKNAQ